MPDDYSFLSPDSGSRGPREDGFLGRLADLSGHLEDFFRRSTLLALLILSIIAGGLTGLVFAYQAGLTSFAAEVEGLADYRPSEITKVYADDGKTVIGELSLERRIPLASDEIPDTMKKAILAIEDTRFDDHIGIDPIRLFAAAIEDIRRNRRAQGASTLTQQLARLLFLKPEKSFIRKIKEIMYALQIERYYTKEQIMTLYCNQIFLGGGAYGVEAAANYYFSKPVKDLTLDQYALIAALPKAPQQYSPVLHPTPAKNRRNLVLQQMTEAGYITQAEADEAKAKPLGLNLDDARGKSDKSAYAYFVEDVRQELQRLLVADKHSQDAMDIYRAGLSVYTTLDAEAQQQAVEAVRHGLRLYEKRHGWHLKFDNVVASEGASLDSYRHPSWRASAPRVDDTITGLILDPNDHGTLVSFGNYSAVITVKNTTAIAAKSPAKLFKRGDLAEFVVKAVDESKHTLTVELEPSPEVQGALILLDAKTGEVKAMVGGYDFATSKFNHATQANRQTGSAFKPFIYATAMEQGLKPDDIVDDAPFRRGNWEPHNYDNTYMGSIPLRKALALSRNIPAVRVLDEVGMSNAQQLVRRIGLPNPMAPFLPSALGATEEPLLAMVSAYSTFPNGGVRVEPVRIKRVVDRDGRVLEDAKPKSYKVVSEYVAAQMVDMMRGSVEFGTATRAKSLGRELAGKTGTVNDYTDAWFIGYTPSIACGVWIGFDEKRTLGKGESGASAALPFWLTFMEQYFKDKPKEKFGKIPELPEDLKRVQLARAHERSDRLRTDIESGDVLPGSADVPNLDPLGGGAPAGKAPGSENAAHPAERPADKVAEPLPNNGPKTLKPTPEPKLPVPIDDDKLRKGKKGKVEPGPPPS